MSKEQALAKLREAWKWADAAERVFMQLQNTSAPDVIEALLKMGEQHSQQAKAAIEEAAKLLK